MSNNKVSNVNIYPAKNSDSSFKAFGDFVYDNAFKVSVKVMEGKNGLFVALPSRKAEIKNKETGKKEEKWVNDIYITDQEVYAAVQQEVLAAYHTAVGSNTGSNNKKTSGKSVTSNGSAVPF